MGHVPVQSDASPHPLSDLEIISLAGCSLPKMTEFPQDRLGGQPLDRRRDQPDGHRSPAPATDPAPTTAAWPSGHPGSGRHPWRWLWPLGQLVVGGVVTVGLVAGVGIWRSGEQFLTRLPTLFIPAVTEPQVDVRTVVVQQLQGASELTTAIFTMETVVPTQSQRTLAGYVIGSTNLLYIAHGEVRAGVDLSKITVDNVRMEGESALRVTLPPPQILDSKLDVSRSTVYNYDRGWLSLGPDNAPLLQTRAQQEALRTIEAAACTTGILAEANRRSEITVGQLLSTAGFESVEVVTQPPLTAACADPANSDRVLPGQN